MAIFANPTSTSRRRCGQAIVESLIVLILLMGAFLLFFDFAYGAVSRLFLTNAAARAARADTVGFNEFHQMKAMRVGMIPVAGKRLVPDHGRFVDSVAQELGLIRTYLQAEDEPEARGILHYERWETLHNKASRKNDLCHAQAEFEIPALLPYKFAALFGMVPTSDTQKIRAHWYLEDHASYYLER